MNINVVTVLIVYFQIFKRVKRPFCYKHIGMAAESADGMAGGGDGDTRTVFECSKDELKELMEYRGSEACDKLASDFGGTLNLCKRLRTSPNEGIHNINCCENLIWGFDK